jgi:preprotein translocase subunit Sec61beta
MADSGMSIPSGMGGLMRFNEEYPSKLRVSPEQVVVFIVIVIIAMTVLKLAF